MSNLVNRYEQLKKQLEVARTNKIQAETNIANLESQKETLTKELLNITATTTVQEALDKLSKLEEKLEKLTEEAEAVLNDN